MDKPSAAHVTVDFTNSVGGWGGGETIIMYEDVRPTVQTELKTLLYYDVVEIRGHLRTAKASH